LTYNVGIDLGTTNTAAARHENGVADIIPLGNTTAEVPSVVLIQTDGSVLTGEDAQAKAIENPTGVLRDFKWRLGDSIPKFIGNKPYTHEQITGYLLRSVKSKVAVTEGSDPARIVIAYPALWGEFKQGKLAEAAKLAGLDMARVSFVTEPEAAALAYDSQAQVKRGESLAIYDLGGGGFDTCVLRRDSAGFTVLGRPERIDRLGGKRFDDVVLNHVIKSLGDDAALFEDASVAVVGQIRQACVAAKEALSNNPSARITVELPGVRQEVLITRDEFHRAIEGDLRNTLDAMEKTVESAGITPSDLSVILLVGGSSRIPIVNQLVTNRFGRPVAIDRHPNYTTALGASMVASGVPDPSGTTTIVKQLFNSTGPPEDMPVSTGSASSTNPGWWPAPNTGEVSVPESEVSAPPEVPAGRSNATRVVSHPPMPPGPDNQAPAPYQPLEQDPAQAPAPAQPLAQAPAQPQPQAPAQPPGQPLAQAQAQAPAQAQPQAQAPVQAPAQPPAQPVAPAQPNVEPVLPRPSDTAGRVEGLPADPASAPVLEAMPPPTPMAGVSAVRGASGAPGSSSTSPGAFPQPKRTANRLWVNLLAIALLAAVVTVVALLVSGI